jgi:hypothetical protein
MASDARPGARAGHVVLVAWWCGRAVVRWVRNQVFAWLKRAMSKLLSVRVSPRWVYRAFFCVNWPVQCIKLGA